MLVIQTLKMLRQEDQQFKASFSETTSPKPAWAIGEPVFKRCEMQRKLGGPERGARDQIALCAFNQILRKQIKNTYEV